VVVAVTSPGWTFRADRRHVEFRDWFTRQERGRMAEKHELPSGTFDESGTNVRALLLAIKKQ